MLLCMILKVIGLVLLFLLLLLLLLLGLVLLVPIRYAGAGHKGEEATDYAAHIDLTWLLHMVQLHAGITPAGLAYSLRILCFHPGDRRKPDTPAANVSDEASSRSEEVSSEDDATANVSDEGSSRSEETTAPDEAVSKDSDEAPSENETVAATEDTAIDPGDDVELQDEDTATEEKQPPEESVNVPESKAEASERAAAQTAEVDSIELENVSEPDELEASDYTEDNSACDVSDSAEEKKEKEASSRAENTQVSTPKKKKRKKSSFADRIKRICEKASSFRETVEDEENQKAVRLLISRVKYLLHHLRFRKFEGQLAFGFEDPATVGRMLAVLSLFYPLYGECFTITPVFDHTMFEGEIALKGHVRLIHILIAGIQLMMNKKIRGLVLDRI